MNKKINTLLSEIRERMEQVNPLEEAVAQSIGPTKEGTLHKLKSGVYIELIPLTNRKTGVKNYSVWITSKTGQRGAPVSIGQQSTEEGALKAAAQAVARITGKK